MQRFFDFTVSFVAIVILFPFLVLCAIVLICTGEGDVLYRQVRVGRGRNEFKVYKFATMLRNSSELPGGTLTLDNDPRVLKFGRFLRKSKINELPQLFNVLRGDMSLVGPRPLVPSGEENYSLEKSSLIRSVRPGLTGIGSLILRDEEAFYSHRADAFDFYKKCISPYKEALEIWYVRNISPLLYLKILGLTAFAVIRPGFDPSVYFPGLPEFPKELIDSKNTR